MRLIPSVTIVALTLAACSGSTAPTDLFTATRIVLSADTLTVPTNLDFALPVTTVYNSSGEVLADQVTWTASDPADVELFTNGFGRTGLTPEVITLTATIDRVSTTAKLTISP